MKFINSSPDVWQLSGQLVMDKANHVLLESQELSLPKTGLKLDFTNVWAVDSSAVSLLLAWVRRGKSEGVAITFANMHENLKTLIKLYGLEEVIRS